MGGTGSGWQRTRKLTVEEGLTLAVKDLVAIGALVPGAYRRGLLTQCDGSEFEYEFGAAPRWNRLSVSPMRGSWPAILSLGFAMLHRAALRRPSLVVHLPDQENSGCEAVLAARRDYVREPESIQPDVPFMPKAFQVRESTSSD